jgi:hypothetical protein
MIINICLTQLEAQYAKEYHEYKGRVIKGFFEVEKGLDPYVQLTLLQKVNENVESKILAHESVELPFWVVISDKS